MVGPEAEHSGIIRAGAHFVEAMATAVVPKIVLTVNHASGAGYYAMAGQGFDPDFILSWPTGRMGVMEGESAVMAVHGPEIERAAEGDSGRSPARRKRVDGVHAGRLRAPARRQVRGGAGLRGRDRHARGDPRSARLPAPRLRQLRRTAPRALRLAAARRGLRPASGAARLHAWLRRAALGARLLPAPPRGAVRPSHADPDAATSIPAVPRAAGRTPAPPTPRGAGRADGAPRGWRRPRLDAARQHRCGPSSSSAHPDLRRARRPDRASSTPASIPASPVSAPPAPASPSCSTCGTSRARAAVPLTRVTPARRHGRDRPAERLRRLRPGDRRSTPTGPGTAARSRSCRWATPPAADLNGNGAVGDTLAVVVTRATRRLGPPGRHRRRRLAGRRAPGARLPRRAARCFGWAPRGQTPPVALAANFGERGRRADARSGLRPQRPRHPRGGHRRGARPLRRARASTAWRPARSSSGSRSPTARRAASPPPAPCCAAMDYAIRFAAARRLPLVMNLSFGVGNELEGQAAHRSPGGLGPRRASRGGAHDQRRATTGPGSPRIGFPGSARPGHHRRRHASRRSSCAPAGRRPRRSASPYFSARGGELAKPDLVTPGRGVQHRAPLERR